MSFSIVYPNPPEIFWNNEHVAGPIGPIKEGMTSKLTCVTSGGRPRPTLTWWREGGQVIADSYEMDGKVRATLTIQASRQLNMRPFSCHAQALHQGRAIAEPLIATVMFDVIRKRTIFINLMEFSFLFSNQFLHF